MLELATITAALQGDPEAFEKVYRQTHDKAYSVAFHILNDSYEAEDVVQDAYITMIEKSPQVTTAAGFESWFYRVVRNSSLDVLRTTHTEVFSSFGSEEDPDIQFEDTLVSDYTPFDPEASADYSELQRIMGDFIADLPEMQRKCILMRFQQDMKISEIASALGIPESTVKSNLTYGKKKIESDVRELEKKGVKLYSVSLPLIIPFLRWMWGVGGTSRKAVAAAGTASAAAGGTAAGVAATASNAAAGSAAVSTGAAVTAKVAVGSAVSAAAGTTAAGVAKAGFVITAKQVIAGILAAAAVGGAAVGVNTVVSHEEPAAIVETIATTEAPNTEPETTEAPTTEPETTEAPTTEPETTEAPTTEPETTEAPTTEPETTEVPTTEPETEHVHTLRSIRTDPTCGTAGSEETVCTDCGEVTAREVLPATGAHSYEEVSRTESTCWVKGTIISRCTECGASKTDRTALLAHRWTAAVTQYPTCTEPGGLKISCTGCGMTAHRSVAALGHDYVKFICTRCGEKDPDHEHTYELVRTEPSCTAEGLEEMVCSGCGDVSSSEILPMTAHSYEEVSRTRSTCRVKGTIISRCTECGAEKTERTARLAHRWTAVVTQYPTCTEPGGMKISCIGCGMTARRSVAALGHDYVNYRCTRCGGADPAAPAPETIPSETIPVETEHVHSWVESTVQPTCTQAGSRSHACSCGADEVIETLPALGHSLTTEHTDATCTTGAHDRTWCTVCGEIQSDTTGAPLGHSLTTEHTDATCTTGAHDRTWCTACGEVQSDTTGAAPGHSLTTEHTDATCTAGAHDRTWCTACGEVQSDTTGAALGHSYAQTERVEPGSSDGYVRYTCSRCGDSYTEVLPAVHVHVWSLSHTDATCTTPDHDLICCSDCGAVQSDTYGAALGHDYYLLDGAQNLYQCSRCGERITMP